MKILLLYLSLVTCSLAQSTNLETAAGAWASSVEGAAYAARNAFDGLDSTRWASAPNADPQWLADDLGIVAVVTGMKIGWENSYAKAYEIQWSNDSNTWVKAYSTSNNTGWVNNIAVSFTGRFVRIYGTARACNCPGPVGYSITNVFIYGYRASPAPTKIVPVPAPVSVGYYTPGVAASTQGPIIPPKVTTNAAGQVFSMNAVVRRPAMAINDTWAVTNSPGVQGIRTINQPATTNLVSASVKFTVQVPKDGIFSFQVEDSTNGVTFAPASPRATYTNSYGGVITGELGGDMTKYYRVRLW